MDYDDLEKEINTNLKSLYLLYGQEQYLIDMSVKKIKKKFDELVQGINYIVIDETNTEEIIPNIEMPAFGYDRKLIIVKNSGLFKKDGRKKTESPIQEKVSNYINENHDMLDESVVLVFIEEEADKNSVFDAVSKYGSVCKIDELKVNQLINKLKKICDLYEVGVSQATLNYFVENCGTNLQNLINEIRKLIEYKGKGGTIEIADINKLSIKQIESIIFDLTDNLATRKIDKSLEILDNLIYQKEPLQKILITLYGHFKKLYICGESINSNKDIVNVLKLKPNQTFLINKYKNQAKHFKVKELRKILSDFADLDYNYKVGNIDLDVGLRSVLCNNCM